MNKQYLAGMVFGLVMFGAVTVHATNVLVSDNPWGYNESANFTDVFGGNYTSYNYSGVTTPATIFNASNSFIMLEGGDGTEATFKTFIDNNTADILSWVSAGGNLLIQSASWYRAPVTLGPAQITGPEAQFSYGGTLTAAGQAAFTFTPTPAYQTGNYLAHDYIVGSGLTIFMVNDSNNPIVAGTNYGSGYIMYSGLTTSNWHNSGNGLVDDVIAYTADAAPVPEPATMLLMGTGLAGMVAAARRRKAKKN